MGKRGGRGFLYLPFVALVVAGCAISSEESSESIDDAASGGLLEQDGAVPSAVAEVGQSVARVLDARERSRMVDWAATSRVPEANIKKRLHTREGRRVSCVALEEQPSVQRLSLAEVERAPKTLEPRHAAETTTARAVGLMDEHDLLAACDIGTVPVPEIAEETLMRFRTLDDFFRKVPSHLASEPRLTLGPSRQLSLQEPHDGPTDPHQYAVYSRAVTNWGSFAIFNVWKPAAELNSEFSLMQTWLVAGTGAQKQTLESGWQVYQDLYGDAEPHLFIYSTRDGYGSTGCYNNSCGDFVQVSRTVFPGVAISPVSAPGPENQKEVAIQWLKDGESGHWWLKYGAEWVGYYPRSLFNAVTGIANHASAFRFGGEIIDDERAGRHTTTDMGSGAFPGSGYGAAAYIRNLRFYASAGVKDTLPTSDATGMTRYAVTDSLCYDVSYATGDPNWGSYLFLGGAGYHPTNCQ